MALLLTFFGKHTQPSLLFQGVTTVEPASMANTLVAGTLPPFNSLMMKIPGMMGLYAGGGIVLAFVLGLLQAQWTYTGYDASAHVAEETVMARLNSAWGVCPLPSPSRSSSATSCC